MDRLKLDSPTITIPVAKLCLMIDAMGLAKSFVDIDKMVEHLRSECQEDYQQAMLVSIGMYVGLVEMRAMVSNHCKKNNVEPTLDMEDVVDIYHKKMKQDVEETEDLKKDLEQFFKNRGMDVEIKEGCEEGEGEKDKEIDILNNMWKKESVDEKDKGKS